MTRRPGGERSVRAYVLSHHPFLWCWVIEDRAGLAREHSWEHHWSAFDSRDAALCAGHARLAELSRSSRGTTAAPRGAAPAAYVIVRRDEAALFEALRRVLRARPGLRVIRDRRFGERRRRLAAVAVERRRGERRHRPDVQALVRALGWSLAVTENPQDRVCDHAGREDAHVRASA